MTTGRINQVATRTRMPAHRQHMHQPPLCHKHTTASLCDEQLPDQSPATRPPAKAGGPEQNPSVHQTSPATRPPAKAGGPETTDQHSNHQITNLPALLAVSASWTCYGLGNIVGLSPSSDRSAPRLSHPVEPYAMCFNHFRTFTAAPSSTTCSISIMDLLWTGQHSRVVTILRQICTQA
jgi:hypothetical protein